MIRRLLAVCAVLALSLFATQIARATQTETHGLRAVPAPGTVTIDGSLRDWDLSGQTLMCYDLETLQDVYSARVSLMYDQDNFYVALHWKAPMPMSNSHDPHYQSARGWAGDSVQLRFKTDRIVHVTGWFYAVKKEPTIQIDYGKSLTEPFGGTSLQLYQTEGSKLTGGAEMAFQKDADGKGYVQEIKLPWKLLTQQKHYRPGEQFNLGVDLLWGSTDWPTMRYSDNLMPGKSSREFFWTAVDSWGSVTLEAKGHLHLPVPDSITRSMHPAAETPGPVALAYTLAKPGRVTLVVEDPQGRRIRNLVPALPRPAGRNIEHWDGLDDNGKAVPAGSYQFRGLTHDGIHLNWALSYANPGHPAWSTPDGHGAFYGDHTNPHAAAAGGDHVALACPMGEGGQPLIGCDLSGQRLWGQANRQAFAGGIQGLATDGKTLWVAAEDTRSYIYRCEIATGNYAPWKREARDEHGQPYQVLDYLITEQPGAGSDAHPALNLTALSYRNGTLAVCLARENKIKLLNAETGDVQREVSVAQPSSVVLDSDGSLIVLSQGRLLRVTPAGASQPFTDATFPEGAGLAIDATRNIYLAVRGREQNVKVFSANGKLLREIGKRGGRPLHGAYLPGGMRNPAGIAIDRQGRLWVTEDNDNPKRTSVWSADGRLVKDLAGCNHYSAAGSLDPFDPTLAYSDDTVYKLDWKQESYQPIYSLHASDSPDCIFPPHVHNITSSILKHDEDRLFYTPDEFGSAVACTVRRGSDYTAAARLGIVQNADELRHNIYASEEHRARYAHSVFKGHVGEFYAWADRNGDGLVQPEEITFAAIVVEGKTIKPQSFAWGTLPGPDGTVTYISREAQCLVQFAVTGYTAAGAPIYAIAHPHIVPVDRKILGEGNGEGMIRGGVNGVVYLNQDPVTAIDQTGHVLFTYPSHFTSVHGSHDASSAHPGYLIGPSSIVGTADLGGEAGEVFDMNGNLGEHYLFTRDGLYVQTLFKDLRGGFVTPTQAVRGISFDASTGGGESFGGHFVRTSDGKVYLTIGGSDATILEVTGLNSIRRLPATSFVYTSTQYAAALARAQLLAQKAASPKMYVVERTSRPPALGDLTADWSDLRDDAKELLEIQDSPTQRFARVQARYDDRFLYLAYRVFSPGSTMHNAGQDERLLFKTGDAVDLMLAPADGRTDTAGKRLLLTMHNGEPEAILYEKTVPGTPTAARVPFASPSRVIYFDRVRQVGGVNGVKLASAAIERGYFVTVQLPWSLLGVTPAAGLKLRADVGVLFADSGGMVTVSRQYWSNKATGLVNDIPGEAELTPSLWGTFVLK